MIGIVVSLLVGGLASSSLEPVGAAGGPATAAEALQPAYVPSQAGELRLYEGFRYSHAEYVIDEGERRAVQAGGILRSIAVHPGDRWQICSGRNFRGSCAVLDRSVPDVLSLGPIRDVRSARRLPHGS